MGVFLVMLATLLPLATGGPCPVGTAYYVPRGLCYWTLLDQLPAEEAHARCGSVHKDGGLSFFPEPEAEMFTVHSLAYSIYPANASGECMANNGQCNTFWLGHRDPSAAGGRYTLWSGGPASWFTSRYFSGSQGECIQGFKATGDSLSWYQVRCATSHRRSICSTWADEAVRARRWHGAKGRIASRLLRTLTARSLVDCARLCDLRQFCASFNFRRTTATCELSFRVLDPLTQVLTSSPGFRHYELRR